MVIYLALTTLNRIENKPALPNSSRAFHLGEESPSGESFSEDESKGISSPETISGGVVSFWHVSDCCVIVCAMKASAQNLCNNILIRAHKNKIDVTPMKLQKLLYYICARRVAGMGAMGRPKKLKDGRSPYTMYLGENIRKAIDDYVFPPNTARRNAGNP